MQAELKYYIKSQDKRSFSYAIKNHFKINQR